MQSRDYGDSQIAWNIYRAFSKIFVFFVIFWGGGGGDLGCGERKHQQPAT